MKRSIRRSLVILGLLFVVAVPLYIELNFRRPIGEGPAGPPVPYEAFKRDVDGDTVWTDRSVKLLGIGDSVTRGLGADRRSHTFFERLRINPPDEFPDMQGKCLSTVIPDLRHENIAVSGSTSLDHARVIDEQLTIADENVFGIVVMTTGGNSGERITTPRTHTIGSTPISKTPTTEAMTPSGECS